MCRLLGIFGQPDNWHDLVMGFQELAESGMRLGQRGHVDGWGMAKSSPDRSGMVPVERQLGSAYQSPIYESAARDLAEKPPKVFLGHLRLASPGIGCTLPNTHPFFCNANGTSWAFIHNGTVYDPLSLERNPSFALNSDDSDTEIFFHHILSKLNWMENIPPETLFRQMITIYKSMLVPFSALNTILSNGSELYVVRWASQDTSYYTLYYAQLSAAVVVCSEPIITHRLPLSSWKLLPNSSFTLISGIRPYIHTVVE
ncbi:MAG: class II glutamine amidotransferase [Candidatus Heimdallarchaeota archaeon]